MTPPPPLPFSSILVEKITKDVSSLSESAKLEVLLTSSPELLSLLDDFKSHMAELNEIMPQWEEIKDKPDTVNTAWVREGIGKGHPVVAEVRRPCTNVSDHSLSSVHCLSLFPPFPPLVLLSLPQGGESPHVLLSRELLPQPEGRGQQEHPAAPDHEDSGTMPLTRSTQLTTRTSHTSILSHSGLLPSCVSSFLLLSQLHLRQTLKHLEPMGEHFANANLDAEEDEDEEDEDGEEESLGEELGEDDEDAGDLAGGEDGEDDEDGDEFDLPAVDPENLAKSDLMSRQASQLDRLISGVGQSKPKSKKGALDASRSAAARSALADYGEVDHRAEMARNVTIGKATGKLAALQAQVAQARDEQTKAARKKRPASGDDDEQDDDDAGGWSANKKSSKKAKVDASAEAYATLKAEKASAKVARKQSFTPTASTGPLAFALGDADHRKVTRQIDANRGLVRSRDKQRKTPKTRNRARWDKKLVARGGAVQEFKESQAHSYGGQATGIKTNVTKSIRL